MVSYVPVAKAIEKVQNEGYKKVVCGGFSAGCDMLLRAIIFAPAHCDMLILQSPWIPILEDHAEDLVNAVKQKNIELKIFCGARDEDCLPMAKQFQSIYTNNILYWKGSSETEYTNKKNVGVSTSCQIRGLKTGSYDFKLVTVNGQGDPLNDTVASEGIELENCSTKLYRVPETPTNIEMEQLGSGNLKLSWNASKYADYYVIQHGESRFDTGYTDMTAEDGSLIATTDTSIEVTLSENPYQDYYRVVAVSGGNAR